MTDLPAPSPEALAISEALSQSIRDRIHAAGGWISFADFMEQALYAPGLGYYSNGSRKFGVEGDFITAPEMGGLFARCVAQQLASWLNDSMPDVLEFGPGSGQLAHDLLLALHAQGKLPRRYLLLERSGDLRQRQQARLANLPEAIQRRIEWLDTLPTEFQGVILANEVLDALPVHRIGWRDHGLVEQGVGLEGNEFSWSERPLSHPDLMPLTQAIAVSGTYTSEICPAAMAWVGSLLQACSKAALLFIDYGYGRAEYYHAQRVQGTLTGFYRHRRIDDPFFQPGLMDLTAHVDFTAIADAAHDNGGQLLGYTTQAAFLLDCGLMQQLQGHEPESTAYMKLAQEAQHLTHPAEMGELFKVMAIGKNLDEPGMGFTTPGREFQL